MLPDSIRELIINTVMNCSFLQLSHILAVYDDRPEITSSGSLMSGVAISRMKEGYSQIRNREKLNIKICLVKNGYLSQYNPEVFSKVMEQV